MQHVQKFLKIAATLAACACTALVSSSSPALADSKKANFELEKAPDQDVECDWSKMTGLQFSECKKRKNYFKGMSGAEKEQHNKDVERRWAGEKVPSAKHDRKGRSEPAADSVGSNEGTPTSGAGSSGAGGAGSKDTVGTSGEGGKEGAGSQPPPQEPETDQIKGRREHKNNL